VHIGGQLAAVNRKPRQRQGNDAEGQVHHLRGMPFRRDQVDHPPFGEQQQHPAIGHLVRVRMRPHAFIYRDRRGAERPDVDLGIEVPGVSEDRTVPHQVEVLSGHHTDRTGRGHEDLPQRGRRRHRQHLEAAQGRVQRPHRIHLGDDDPRAKSSRPGGYSRPAGAEPGDHHGLGCQQGVGRAQDAVDHRLTGAARVVEHALGRGVVRGDHRKCQRAIGGHPAQPDHPGGRRLTAAAHSVERSADQRRRRRVQRVHQVAAVVHHQIRAISESRRDMPVVPGPVHSGPGKHLDALIARKGESDVVLRRQRIRGRERHPRPACLQQPDQHRGLRRHMQAGRHRQSRERLLPGEPGQQAGHERHGALRVVDTRSAQASF
jgi:hypothetical protein